MPSRMRSETAGGRVMTEPGAGQDEAGLLFSLVRQRYGERLTAAELEAVRAGVATIVDARAGPPRGPARERGRPGAPRLPRRPAPARDAEPDLPAAPRARSPRARATRLAGGPDRGVPRAARDARAPLQRGRHRHARARAPSRRGAPRPRSRAADGAARFTASRTAPRTSSRRAAASPTTWARRALRGQTASRRTRP